MLFPEAGNVRLRCVNEHCTVKEILRAALRVYRQREKARVAAVEIEEQSAAGRPAGMAHPSALLRRTGQLKRIADRLETW